MSEYLNERLRSLNAYVPGEQPDMQQTIKLNTNESPFPPAPGVAEAVKAAAGSLNLYNDLSAKALVGLLADLVGNPLLTLVQATGRVKKYYLVTGLTSYLGLPLVWLAFRLGAGPAWAYIIFIAVYLTVLVQRIVIAHRLADFPVKPFLRLILLLVMTTCFALVFPIVLRGLDWAPLWRLLLR